LGIPDKQEPQELPDVSPQGSQVTATMSDNQIFTSEIQYTTILKSQDHNSNNTIIQAQETTHMRVNSTSSRP